jgi:hypothetical protein
MLKLASFSGRNKRVSDNRLSRDIGGAAYAESLGS